MRLSLDADGRNMVGTSHVIVHATASITAALFFKDR